MKNNQKDKLIDYLQARQESRLAILLSVVFILFYIAGGVVLAMNEARYYIYLSLGNISLFTIAGVSILRPLTRKVQLEKAHPDWKAYPSKGVPLSSQFVTSVIMIFGCSSLALMMTFSQAMATKPQRIQLEDIPTLPSSSLIPSISGQPPRLAPESQSSAED